MKSKALKFKLLVIGLLLTTHLFSQNLINPENINSDTLAEIFRGAYYEVVDVKSSYIKVKDGVNTFFDIDGSKRFVSMSGSFILNDKASKKQKLELMNKINTGVILIKCYYKEKNNSINFMYHFWTEGGFTDSSLIKAYKMYRKALSRTLEIDTQKIIK